MVFRPSPRPGLVLRSRARRGRACAHPGADTRPAPLPGPLAAERAAVDAGWCGSLQETLARSDDSPEPSASAQRPGGAHRVPAPRWHRFALRDQTAGLSRCCDGPRSGSVGRGHAAPARRVRRDAAARPLRGAGQHARRRRRPAAAPDPWSTLRRAPGRRRREGAAVVVPRRRRGGPTTPPRGCCSRATRARSPHVDRLASKEYWRRHWSPSSSCRSCRPSPSRRAPEARPDLLEHAFARDVVIATPTTLLRPAAHRGAHLAAGGGDPQRPRRAAVATCMQPARHARRPPGQVSVGPSTARSREKNAAVGSLESRVLVTAR